MDLFTPADPRPVHFVGIGGAGMSALALIALRRGVAVTGCDTDLSGTGDVAAAGAHIRQGHDPEHVAGARAVVVTAAVAPTHPELIRARDLGVPVVPRKQALADLIAAGQTVAVAGTHGKTTTTVMTTEALTAAGLEPTGIVGGRVAAWGGNALVAGQRHFVVEADEYDKAFLTLRPSLAVITNVEADHLECYGSMAALEDAFVEFAGRAATVLYSADDQGARAVATRLRGPRVVPFGEAADAEVRIDGAVLREAGTEAAVHLPDGTRHALRLRVPGRHNLRNAVAALGAVWALGRDPATALPALARFRGVGRRFERLGEVGEVVVVDDYAHHPTELRETLAAARQAFPGRRLVAVFQPHLYSRTAEHGGAMGRALAAADLVVVTDVYPAREQPLPGITGRLVADAAVQAGVETVYVPERHELLDRVRGVLRPGDAVLTLGAGDITRVGRDLVACAPSV